MDPSQIDQIMVNLCINARDAITGTCKITIRTNLARIGESDAKILSKPGQGTVFTIYLPRYIAAAAQPMPETNPEIRDITGHETILLVEDEPSVLAMCQDMLETLGYNVLSTPVPEDAIRTAASPDTGSIHLLLTDIVMPGMNGRELAGHITALKPGIRCLYMSGYPRDIISPHSVLDPNIHFIQKPFSLGALSGKLCEVLDNGDRGNIRQVNP